MTRLFIEDYQNGTVGVIKCKANSLGTQLPDATVFGAPASNGSRCSCVQNCILKLRFKQLNQSS